MGKLRGFKEEVIRASGFEQTAMAFRSDTSRLASRVTKFGASAKIKMLFIHIPKTAGTAIELALLDEFGLRRLRNVRSAYKFNNQGPVTFGHMAINDLVSLGIVNQSFLGSSFKFSITRDPYARAVSLYNYLRGIGVIEKRKCFAQFLLDVHHKRPPVGLYGRRSLSQANPQVDWLIGANGDFLTDKIFDVAEIEKLSDDMRKRFGKPLSVKKINVSKKVISIEDALKDSEAKELIETIYRRDFDILRYKKIPR
jgi:hypothetical protein